MGEYTHSSQRVIKGHGLQTHLATLLSTNGITLLLQRITLTSSTVTLSTGGGW